MCCVLCGVICSGTEQLAETVLMSPQIAPGAEANLFSSALFALFRGVSTVASGHLVDVFCLFLAILGLFSFPAESVFVFFPRYRSHTRSFH